MIEYLLLFLLFLIIGLVGIILLKVTEFIKLFTKINIIKRKTEYDINDHACVKCDIVD
jgi:hypothetical protein